MARRRRRTGNKLLIRILVISVAVHLIAVPILAYYGAFNKLGIGPKRPVDIVMLAAPPVEKQPEVKKTPKAPPHRAAKGAGPKHAPAAKGTPLKQHVVAAAPTGAGTGGNGPTVVNPEKGAAPGTLPPSNSTPPPSNSKPGNGGGGAPPSTTPKAPPPPPPPPTTTPVVPPIAPKPHVPVVTDVAPTFDPSPVIPDDLRDSAFDSTVTAQFLVSPTGDPTDVKILKSSGNDELDSIVLDTAKKWRFKPATRDGQPTEGRVILHIEFEVQ